MTKKSTSIYRKYRRKNRYNCGDILMYQSIQCGYVDPATGEMIDLPEHVLYCAEPDALPRD